MAFLRYYPGGAGEGHEKLIEESQFLGLDSHSSTGVL
jgi:hypothetical protein